MEVDLDSWGFCCLQGNGLPSITGCSCSQDPGYGLDECLTLSQFWLDETFHAGYFWDWLVNSLWILINCLCMIWPSFQWFSSLSLCISLCNNLAFVQPFWNCVMCSQSEGLMRLQEWKLVSSVSSVGVRAVLQSLHGAAFSARYAAVPVPLHSVLCTEVSKSSQGIAG